ncbi:MAG TPA: tol-pal system protein YbgF [Gemmatimonadales bacterium]|nr:tol-pal system protein YbgF [Gemmatimonadales bacterium]
MPSVCRLSPLSILVLAAGCALKGDVRRVQLQVEALRADQARADSARILQVDSLLTLIAEVQRTLAAQQSYLVQFRGDVKTDLLAVQQQVVTLQELAGVSQQKLTELRSQIEQRQQQPVPQVDTSAGAAAGAAVPPADQMYGISLDQFKAGRYATARQGFREFLRLYAGNDYAPDALFYIGESFNQDQPDSAAVVYESVVRIYPNSPRAPTALYKLGQLAERRNDKAGARTYYARVIAGYPRSDEANLARDRLQRLGR